MRSGAHGKSWSFSNLMHLTKLLQCNSQRADGWSLFFVKGKKKYMSHTNEDLTRLGRHSEAYQWMLQYHTCCTPVEHRLLVNNSQVQMNSAWTSSWTLWRFNWRLYWYNQTYSTLSLHLSGKKSPKTMEKNVITNQSGCSLHTCLSRLYTIQYM